MHVLRWKCKSTISVQKHKQSGGCAKICKPWQTNIIVLKWVYKAINRFIVLFYTLHIVLYFTGQVLSFGRYDLKHCRYYWRTRFTILNTSCQVGWVPQCHTAFSHAWRYVEQLNGVCLLFKKTNIFTAVTDVCSVQTEHTLLVAAIAVTCHWELTHNHYCR